MRRKSEGEIYFFQNCADKVEHEVQKSCESTQTDSAPFTAARASELHLLSDFDSPVLPCPFFPPSLPLLFFFSQDQD